MPWYIDEDNYTLIVGLQLKSTGAYVNSGSGTWELKDANGTVIGSGSAVYVASTNGNWGITIPSTVTSELVERARYYLEITLSNGAGADGFRKIGDIAMYHGANP